MYRQPPSATSRPAPGVLARAYADYLRAGARREDAETLARALEASGEVERAALLHAYAVHGAGTYALGVGPREGRAVHVGPQLPPPEVGSYWFDTCDLSTSILVQSWIDPTASYAPGVLERATAHKEWFALDPVTRWQLAAFLDAAPLERAHPTALDRNRLIAGPEHEPVTTLMCEEAWLYLYWFGKYFPDDGLWYSARAGLGIEPWHTPACEWAGFSSRTSGYVTFVTPATAYRDPDDDVDHDDEEVTEGTILHDVTFRSAVRLDNGGLKTDGADTSRAGRLRAHRAAYASLAQRFARNAK
ncbi:MAG: hypothetical protein JWM74_2318 [Myxococcaceae bacterium]|nr:hypothetical protein [Myxococcaceae bacterium]